MLASPILLAESDIHEIQTMGEPQMMILDSSDEVRVSAEDLSSRPASKAPVSIINAEIDYEPREDPSFSVSMSRRSRRSNKKKSGSDSRGNQAVRPIPDPRFEGCHRPGEPHFVGLDKRKDRGSPKPWGRLHNEYRAPSPPLGWKANTLSFLTEHRRAEGTGKRHHSGSDSRCLQRPRTPPLRVPYLPK